MLADDAIAVAHQISKEVEHLGFERDQFDPAAQFASFDIEHVIAKPENHPALPQLGAFLKGKPILTKRQAQLKSQLRTS